jgi:hypothetical protein
MIREFKSHPRRTGMFDAEAQIVGARVDQPRRGDGEKLNGAGGQA